MSDPLRSLLCVAVAFVLTGGGALAQPAKAPSPAEIRRIQETEARRADERTLAYLTTFKAALVARFGADPKLLMLVVSEVEGTALVVTGAGAPEFVIWQQGKWLGTDGRQLKPWAPAAVATANAFPLSKVRDSALRGAMQAWRRAPEHATDFLGDISVGYDPRARMVVARHMTGSMSTGGLGQFVYDPESGRRIEIVGPVRKTDDLRNDVEQGLIALRDAAPARRLGAVRIARGEIVFVLDDRATFRFDTAYELNAGERDEYAAVCPGGFAETDVAWTRVPELPRDAIARTDLDAEDIPHASFVIDRGRACGPIIVEVVFDNYKAPKPRVRFDARGAYVGKSW